MPPQVRSRDCSKARSLGEVVYLTSSGGKLRFPKLPGQRRGTQAWIIMYQAKWVRCIKAKRDPWVHFETTRVTSEMLPNIVPDGQDVYLWVLEDIQLMVPPLVMKAKRGPVGWVRFSLKETMPMILRNAERDLAPPQDPGEVSIHAHIYLQAHLSTHMNKNTCIHIHNKRTHTYMCARVHNLIRVFIPVYPYVFGVS